MNGFRSNSQAGFALPLVLVLIVVITTALVSLLVISRNDATSSRGYARGVQVRLLADLAIDDLISDLRTEISRYEGSRANWGSDPDALRIGVLPAQVLPGLASDLLDRKLHPVLRASSSDPAYAAGFAIGGISPPLNRASSINSVTDPAMTNRRILPARWRATGLVPDAVAGALTWPDWVYVTRDGSRALDAGDLATARRGTNQENTGQVLGRYAFLLFDVSGLLDVNVAGAAAGVDPGTKGGTHFARLDSLLGADMAEALLAWRNVDALSDGYAERLYGTDETLGAIELQRVGEAGPDANQLFARQDLLEMRDNSGLLDNVPDEVIEKLRTWSAASLAPDDVRVYDEADGRARRLSDYTITTELSVPSYAANGTRSDYTIQGSAEYPKPQFSRRFPLARLRWLAAEGTALDAAIRQHFGLRRSSGLTVDETNFFSGWVYTSPDGSSPVNRIKSLSEISGREPDFFEWLKAVIDPGSLGISGGNTSTMNQGLRDASRDLQILRIGANIIDQADDDDVPTVIYTDVANGVGELVFGVENLPYINEMLWSFHREGESDPLNFWTRFELWNPHRNAQDPSATLPRSTTGNLISQFRVRFTRGGIMIAAGKAMEGTQGTGNILMHSEYLGNTAPSRNRYRGVHGPGVESTAFFNLASAGPLTFSLPNSAANAPVFYEEPALVDDRNRSDVPPILANRPLFDPGIAPNNENLVGALRIGSHDLPAVAIDPGWSGDSNAPPGMITLGGNNYPVASVGIKRYDELRIFLDGADERGVREPASVVLELLDDGNWRPVQMISEIREIIPKPDSIQSGSNQPTNWTTDHADTTMNSFYGWNAVGIHKSIFKIDPRTPRWGVSSNTGGSAGRSIRPDLSPLTFATSAPESAPWDGSDFFFPGQDRVGTSATTQSGLEPGWTINRTGTAGRRSGMAPWLVANSADREYHYREQRLLAPGGTQSIVPATDYVALMNEGDFPTIPGSKARPVILNRPFRSIGELGYVFRDTPWRTLDFFNPDSADYGLAGVFSVEGGAVTRGRINPLTAPREILTAVLTGTQRDSWDEDQLTDSEIVATLDSIDTIARGATLPADVGELVRMLNTQAATVSGTGPKRTKIRGEAAARALADATDLRTWNLLLDLIVQAGDLPEAAQSLSDFYVTAERRYWVHLAIDRVTGDLIGLRVEPRSD